MDFPVVTPACCQLGCSHTVQQQHAEATNGEMFHFCGECGCKPGRPCIRVVVIGMQEPPPPWTPMLNSRTPCQGNWPTWLAPCNHVMGKTLDLHAESSIYTCSCCSAAYAPCVGGGVTCSFWSRIIQDTLPLGRRMYTSAHRVHQQLQCTCCELNTDLSAACTFRPANRHNNQTLDLNHTGCTFRPVNTDTTIRLDLNHTVCTLYCTTIRVKT